MQVWDAVNGDKLHTFDGHEAPVYSICPHHKENFHVSDTFSIPVLAISNTLVIPLTNYFVITLIILLSPILEMEKSFSLIIFNVVMAISVLFC